QLQQRRVYSPAGLRKPERLGVGRCAPGGRPGIVVPGAERHPAGRRAGALSREPVAVLAPGGAVERTAALFPHCWGPHALNASSRRGPHHLAPYQPCGPHPLAPYQPCGPHPLAPLSLRERGNDALSSVRSCRCFEQRRKLGWNTRAEHVARGERGDLSPRAGRALRTRRPRAALLTCRAVSCVGAPPVVAAYGPLSPLASLAAGASRPTGTTLAPGALPLDDPGEEGLVAGHDDVDPAASPAAATRPTIR